MQSISKLKSKNFSAFVQHLICGFVLLFLYNYYNSEQFSNAQLFRYNISGPNDIVGYATCSTGTEEPDRCNTEIAFTKPKQEFTINVIFGAIFFFFFTALAHLYYASDGFSTGEYTRFVKAGWNPIRWGEYAVSASVMTVLVAMVQGVRDSSTVGSLAVITAAMQMCGLAVESNLKYLVKPNQDSIYASTSAGWILFVGLWGILIYNFAIIVNDVKDKYSSNNPPIVIPAWIWFVVLSNFLFYASFGILQAVHIGQRMKPGFSFLNIENWYINLSLISKISLAAGIGYGLIFRTRDCPA
jgi:hypothetical protein